MNNKRTNWDFSQNILTITEYKNNTVYDFKRPDSIVGRVKITNIEGICLITGDFGRWSFCREFHPLNNATVSEEYWLEKLNQNSTQQPTEWNPNDNKQALYELINELKQEFHDEYQKYDHNHNKFKEELDDHIEFINDLIGYTEDEIEFISFAKEHHPNNFDTERIPEYRSIKHQLNIVFDAFEQMAKQL